MKHANTLIAAHRHRNVRIVDTVLNVTVTQVLVKLNGSHYRTVVLGLLGRSTKVRNCHDTGNTNNLLGREVGYVGSNLARFQCDLQIVSLDEVGTREVDDANALLHNGERFSIDHALGLGGRGHVKRYVIGYLEYVLIGSSLYNVMINVPCGINAQIRVTSNDLHAERHSGIGNQTADRAKTDDAKGLSCDLTACELGLACLNGLGNALGSRKRIRPLNTANHVARCEHQRANGKLLNTVCVGTGGIEYHNSLLRTTVNGNIVHTRTCTGDSKHLFAKLHIMHSRRANHDGIGIFNGRTDRVKVTIKLIRTDRGDLIQAKNIFHSTKVLSDRYRTRSRRALCFFIVMICFYALGFSAANFFMKATRAATPS